MLAESRFYIFTVLLCLVIGFPGMKTLAQDESTKEPQTSVSNNETPESSTKPKPKKSPEKDPVPPYLKPYKINISVAFGLQPSLNQKFQKQFSHSVRETVRRTIGQAWNLDIESSTLIAGSHLDAIHQLDADQFKTLFGQSEYDKVFAITVSHTGSAYDIQCREWDRLTQDLGPTRSKHNVHRKLVPQQTVKLIQSLFRPVLHITFLEENLAELALVAGDYPISDPQSQQIRVGDLLVPYFRYLEKDRSVNRIQRLPWTYLNVEDVNRGYVTCRYVSALRRALGSRRRRRVELVALRIQRPYQSTTVEVVRRQTPPRPLAGHSVKLVRKLYARDEAVGEPQELLTDRFGRIEVPVSSEVPLVWLYVYSGTALMARVPLAPGVEEHEELQLSDDSLRLATEGEIELLKSRLIDTVARRMTLLVQAKRHATAGEKEAAELVFAKFEQLPGIRDFERDLAAIQVPAVRSAQEMRMRSAEMKIKKICNDAKKLIDRYLDAEKIQPIISDIRASLSN